MKKPPAERSPKRNSGPVHAAAILAASVLLTAMVGGCAEIRRPLVRKPAAAHIGPDPEFTDLAPSTPFSHADLQKILDVFVDEDGRVEYVSLKWADEPLRRYLAMAAKVAPKEGVKDAHFPDANHRLAYWINVYNAATLAAVRRFYPIERVDEMDGLFTDVTFTIGGRRMSLERIEREMQRRFPYQWRAGFALCRASAGSPKLRESVYQPVLLAGQIEEQFADFLDTDHAVDFDAETKTLKLSPVFEKYAAPMRDEARRVLKINSPTMRDVLRGHADAKLSHRISLAVGYRIRFMADPQLNDRDYEQITWSAKNE